MKEIKLDNNFQQKLLGFLFSEPTLSESAIIKLPVDVFTNKDIRDLYKILKNYYKNYNNVPNKELVKQLIEFEFPDNESRVELLEAVLNESYKKYNENEKLFYKDTVEKIIRKFLVEEALDAASKLNKGESLNDKEALSKIRDLVLTSTSWKIQKLDDMSVFDNFDDILKEDYRHPISTGIDVLDNALKGGLGKGELGMILAPRGVGKTTILTKIATTAYLNGYNVLHIFFEDNKAVIKRKHYAAWTGLDFTELHNHLDKVEPVVKSIRAERKNHLLIERMIVGESNIHDIKNLIRLVEAKYGKLDMVVVDYVDCIAAAGKNTDSLEAEYEVVRGVEAICSSENVAVWTATQGNRNAIDKEEVDGQMMAGNIKKSNVAHFLASIGKTPEQKVSKTATISILKSRVGTDGQIYENITFNNGNLVIGQNPNTGVPMIKPIKEEISPAQKEEKNKEENLLKNKIKEKLLEFK